MSDTSVPGQAEPVGDGAAPRNPGLNKLFEAAAAREARSQEVKPAPHPHAWLEPEEAPRRKPAARIEPDPHADAPAFGPALQGRGPMTAGVVITLAALVAAAAVWLLIFGG